MAHRFLRLPLIADRPGPGIFYKVALGSLLQTKTQVAGVLLVKHAENPSPPVEEGEVMALLQNTGHSL